METGDSKAQNTAVRVNGHKPESFAIELLRTLEESGIVSPVLFGGAIRDRMLGIEDKIHDYDVWGHFSPDIDLSQDRDSIPNAVLEHLKQGLPDLHLTRFEGFDRSDQTGFTALKIIFDYQGREASLFLNNQAVTMDEKIQGDAPINAVVMDSQGNTLGHPEFEEHVRKKIYAPFEFVPPESAQARYTHLQKKIPDLYCEKFLTKATPPAPPSGLEPR